MIFHLYYTIEGHVYNDTCLLYEKASMVMKYERKVSSLIAMHNEEPAATIRAGLKRTRTGQNHGGRYD